LLVFGVAVPLLAIELLLRAAPIANLFSDPEDRAATVHLRHHTHPMIFDEALGWTPTPGARQPMESKIQITILSSGLRSNGRSQPFDSDATILAMGASYTFGDGVNDSETWPAHLESLLNHRVLNGGVSSYGLDQSVLRAERLVEKFRPEMLIVGTAPNNITRTEYSTRHYAPKPFFLETKNGITLDRTPLARWETIFRLKYPETLEPLLDWSELARLLESKIIPQLAFNYDKNYMYRRHKDGINISCHLMKRLSNIKEKYKIPVIILIQYEKGLNLDNEVRMDGFLECVSKNGLELVDTQKKLIDIKNNSNEEFWTLYDEHMTPKGNYFTAKLIQDYIAKSQYANSIFEN